MANIIQNSAEDSPGHHLKELLRKNSSKGAHALSFVSGSGSSLATIGRRLLGSSSSTLKQRDPEVDSIDTLHLAQSSVKGKKREELTPTSRKGKEKQRLGERFRNRQPREIDQVGPSRTSTPNSLRAALKPTTLEESDSQSSTEEEESDSDSNLYRAEPFSHHDGPFDENCPVCRKKALRKLVTRNMRRKRSIDLDGSIS
ncbi:hypothetical protein O181_005031 [Austropuccinia psidii MF-1]|uniref:Uncharacterized protein n=1 Tax=Austropuccinia psidii MF-1 TaxID=1389203 RepID=A0A9Q3BGL1_9BASI|nr:hypothetical protein [Austropuccinia psidii MF-1]